MTQAPLDIKPDVIYPDCDGQPMANNTEQYEWLVMIQQNLDWLYADQDVFVAGDLFWYPIEGDNKTVVAPDVLVVFGRPKGKRGSYLQWREDNIAPQVIFEILSPSNTQKEMDRKLLFFNQHGVEEYYIYDPAQNDLRVFLRGNGGLQTMDVGESWTSPRMEIRFDLSGDGMELFRPDGRLFVSYQEISQRLEAVEQERDRAQQERDRAQQERDRAQQELEQERARSQALADRLREMGIQPDKH